MFDAIVIGSGFGGAIIGCRLAEKGLKVLILERGKWWTKETYPREPGDEWIWSPKAPEKFHGWLDLRRFKKMAVAQGAAVGGGSLIYANVSTEAPPKVFESGWPAEITYNELKPYYDKVAKFMNVQKVPANQWNPRMKLVKEAAEKAGFKDRFRQLELAVSFDPNLQYDFKSRPDPAKSTQFTNAQGVQQGTCAHLGECDIGCPVYAKNTLDKNYIPWAMKHAADVRALHLVTNIEPQDSGFKVSFDRLDKGGREPGSETGKRVIIAAGSLGSTELLLRCKRITKSLPKISDAIGRGWSSNGDFLTPATYLGRAIIPNRGPTISSVIDFLDGSQNGQVFWVQDGGFPNLFGMYYRDLSARLANQSENQNLLEGFQAASVLQHLITLSANFDLLKFVMPWFSQAVDAADGQLHLDDSGQLNLKWDVQRSLPAFNEVVEMHKRLSQVTGGLALVPPGWTIAHDLITPHPLGGCRMANLPSDGVVNHAGKVFGYENLYVGDGAVLPRAVGVNPSRTIGAVAERIAALMN
jgi:cholesterol oxidase